MSNNTYEFYAERAEESAAAARAATLENVRERALRSAATWQALADKARAVTVRREKAAMLKAAEQDAEDTLAEERDETTAQ